MNPSGSSLLGLTDKERSASVCPGPRTNDLVAADLATEKLGSAGKGWKAAAHGAPSSPSSSLAASPGVQPAPPAALRSRIAAYAASSDFPKSSLAS